jgi:DNA-binding response OmpR family regulator
MGTTNIRILICDDDPDIVEFLSYNLKKAGYEVITAGSGLNALWEVEDDRLPDLILLDLMMPSPDGYEVCQFLKSSDEFRQIPLIIISAKGSREDIEKGLGYGANAYLPKPFTIDELFGMIRQVV